MRSDWYTFLDRTRRPNLVAETNVRKYSIIRGSCIVALFVHACFLLLFSSIGAQKLVYFNILSLAAWSVAAGANYRGKHQLALTIGLVEAVMHASYVVSQLGLAMGFQYYLWPISCLVAMIPIYSLKTSSLVSITTVLTFGFLNWLWKDTPYTYNYPTLVDYIYLFNLLASSFPLVVGMMMVRSMNEHQESLLSKMAHRDELTGLFNRRYMNRYFEEYLASKDGSLGDLTLALGDVDHFKNVNDTYGHDVGDSVLQSIAKHLKSGLRKSDFVCRWGGEEFMIVFPKSVLEEIEPVIEKIRVELENMTHIDVKGSITMSFGLAQLGSEEPFDNLVKRADAALYQAKESGRNRVVHHDGAELSPRCESLAI